MNAIVLCNFDSVDLADLAAGRLRAKFPEISDIVVSRAHIDDPRDDRARIPFFGAIRGVGAIAPTSGSGIAANVMVEGDTPAQEGSDFVPRSVTMRVTCPQGIGASVRAKLVNLGAQGIRAFP